MYKEKIVNVATGEETWRDYTLQEIAEVEKALEIAAQEVAAEQVKSAKRQEVLAKLGLTAEEAQALLG
jgi:hypothetical protein